AGVKNSRGDSRASRNKFDAEQRKSSAAESSTFSRKNSVNSSTAVGEAAQASAAELPEEEKLPDGWVRMDPDHKYNLNDFVDRAAHKCQLVVLDDTFNAGIIGFIVVAAVIVGMQTYPSLEAAGWVNALDQIVLGVFTVEVAIKMGAEGRRPWRYFTGRERAWNCFDFVIVLLCMPFIPLSGGSIAFLRLLRLMRVAKLVKRVPQLQIIIMGLANGMASVAYILLLLLLVFYMFSIIGELPFPPR
ncbi:unnamed protein product, partial [Chrysoparadoxa australica]